MSYIEYPKTEAEKKIITWKTIEEGKGITHQKKYLISEVNKTEVKAISPQTPPQTTIQNIPKSKEEAAKEIQEFIKNIPQTSSPQQAQEVFEQLMNLIMQMGSESSFLSRGQIDERKLANINENDQLSLGHFNYRAIVDKIRYYGIFVDWILVTSNSINGLRARQLIQLASSVSGTPQQEFVQKPSWVGRHITDRDWEEKARQSGATIIG